MSTEEPQLKKRKMSSADAEIVAPSLLVKRLSEKAKVPTRGSAFAAGYDLYRYCGCPTQFFLLTLADSAEKKTIPAHGKALVDTQISIAVPAGTYGRVAPRSGLGRSLTPQGNSSLTRLASKFMIDTGAGVIDADYRGVVFVLLFNLSDKDFEGLTPSLAYPQTERSLVEEGDRIAQLIIEKIYTPDVQEVQVCYFDLLIPQSLTRS